MATEKSQIDYELLKRLIEESGMSTMDIISKVIGLGNSDKCTSCDRRCVTCNSTCSNGPSASRNLDQYIIYPHEWERLKKEIVAELRG